ncbi:MAG: cytochrome c3 family protein, partial [Rubrivirga sp.]
MDRRTVYVIALVAAVAGCASDPSPVGHVGLEAEYVGVASCATCHGEIAASYASHGMAESMAPWTSEVRIEPLLQTPIVDPVTGFEYRVLEVEGQLVQEERQVDAGGLEVARLVRPMDWIVGSGDAARTYFAGRGDGLTQLPLTWYTQTGEWDWSPGYEDGVNPRFSRTMPDGCMSCHNAVPERVTGVEGAFASIPEGIGCERCHGPGSAHVEARLADDSALDGPDPTIINTAYLDLDLRLDACSQCHLHASIDVLRQGETAYSYQPGRPLSSHEGLFAIPADLEADDGVAVVSHAARMQASACFQESVDTAAPLECTTCHDPHRGFEARPAGAQSASCTTCHASDLEDAVPADLREVHALEVGCVGCHMPKVEASTAPHSSFTDHWIRVVDGPVRAVQPELGRSGVVAPLEDGDRDGLEGGLYEGVAAITYGSQASDPQALAQGAQFVQIALDRIPQPERYHDARYLLGVALL